MPARTTQSPVEVLLETEVSSRVTQSSLTVLLDDTDRTARVSQIVLEVLHKWIPAPIPAVSSPEEIQIRQGGRLILV